MSLRIQPRSRSMAAVSGPTTSIRAGTANAAPPADAGDSWLTRLVKMVPAEAIGLYGTALPHVEKGRYGLQAAAVMALVVALVIRYAATNERGKRPQIVPLVYASISFGLWLSTLPEGQSPISVHEDFLYVPTLLTLAWVMVAPLLYKGT